MKEQLLALLATTAITNGTIIATYDGSTNRDPNALRGAKFTVTYEDESIIQVPSGDVVGHAGLKVTIKAEGNPDVFIQQAKFIFNKFDIRRTGTIWATGSDFVFTGETIENPNIAFNELNFWDLNNMDRLIFNDGDEFTMFYAGVKESDVNTKLGAQWIRMGVVNSNPNLPNVFTNMILPDRTETIPEPSAALLSILAALGTLRRKRIK
jgi:hypothetical protein